MSFFMSYCSISSQFFDSSSVDNDISMKLSATIFAALFATVAAASPGSFSQQIGQDDAVVDDKVRMVIFEIDDLPI